MAGPPKADGLVGILQGDIDRLQKSAQKLVESNAELKAAIAEEGDEDREFKTAIEVRAAAAAWDGTRPLPPRRCRNPLPLLPSHHLPCTYLQENIVVIAKHRAQIERLEQELRELRGGRQQLGGAAIAATEEGAAGGAAGAQQPSQPQQQGDSIAAVHGGGDTAMQDAAADEQQQAGQAPAGATTGLSVDQQNGGSGWQPRLCHTVPAPMAVAQL